MERAKGRSNTMLDNYKVCCICGKVFEGYGNDPWPVREEGRCCDDCNIKIVVPARIAQLKTSEEKKCDKDYFACVEMDCLWNDGLGKCICPTNEVHELSPDRDECKFYSQD